MMASISSNMFVNGLPSTSCLQDNIMHSILMYFSSFHRLHSVFVISRWIVSVNLAFVRLILLWYPHLMIILHKFVECRNCVRPLTLRALWTPPESRYSRPRCATVSSWFSFLPTVSHASLHCLRCCLRRGSP